PPDAFAFAELRLDLPGDQAANVEGFLGAIPGMDISGGGIGAIVDQLALAGEGPFEGGAERMDDWDWIDGTLMLGFPDVPPVEVLFVGDMEDVPAGLERPYAVAAIGIADRAAFDVAWPQIWDGIGEDASEEYGGTTSWTALDEGETTVAAVAGDLLLLGMDVDRIKAAVDLVNAGGPSLAQDPAYLATIATLPADRLGTFVISTGVLRDVLPGAVEALMAGQDELEAATPQLLEAVAALPDHVAGVIRAEPDHLSARIVAALPEDAELAVGSSDLAELAPADSVLFLEARDVGAALKAAFGQARPALETQIDAESLMQIEMLLGGALDDLLAWAGDLALSVSFDASGPSFGIVAEVTDPVAAEQRISGILALVRMVALGAEESPIIIDDTTAGEVAITSIELTEASGMTDELPVAPRITVGLGGGHFFLGLGDFAIEAATRAPADSLAADPSYQAGVAAASAENAGYLWVDVPGLLGLAALVDPGGEMDAEALAMVGTIVSSLVAVLDVEEGNGSAALLLVRG
ncbi:MAG: DUF3352 domain-containing protein, partial [Chloroflexota bacterium]